MQNIQENLVVDVLQVLFEGATAKIYVDGVYYRPN